MSAKIDLRIRQLELIVIEALEAYIMQKDAEADPTNTDYHKGIDRGFLSDLCRILAPDRKDSDFSDYLKGKVEFDIYPNELRLRDLRELKSEKLAQYRQKQTEFSQEAYANSLHGNKKAD